MYLCVMGIDFDFFYDLFLLDFRTVPAVWHFFFFFLLHFVLLYLTVRKQLYLYINYLPQLEKTMK